MTSWVQETVYGLGGYETVRPDRVPWHVLNGYDPSDFAAVFRMSRTLEGFAKSYAEVATQVAGEAAAAAAGGHRVTAARLYHRAALLYGRGQYHLFEDSDLKRALYARSRECYSEVLTATNGRVTRESVPFANASVHAIVHRPVDDPLGCVIVVPGMDAFKEERHVTASMLTERGFLAIVMDGPGQGESLIGGLKVSIDNYERAVTAVIDTLAQPIAGDVPIGIFGTSMGSYWASRAAAHDPRIAACAVAMGCYGPMRHMFTAARPAFRANYKFMTGISDDLAFDDFVAAMEIDQLASGITVPYLMVHGEYDELNDLADALSWFDRVPEPKQAWIYEDEIHPMGRRAGDFLPATLDWICGRLLNQVPLLGDQREYVRSRDRGGGRIPFQKVADTVRLFPNRAVS